MSLTELMASKFKLSSAQFNLGAQDLPLNLQSKAHLVQWRLSVLLKLNVAFIKLFPLVNSESKKNLVYQAEHFSIR